MIKGEHIIPMGHILFPSDQWSGLTKGTGNLVDGKALYPHKAAGYNYRSDCGAISTERLSVGRHTLQYEIDYSVDVGGQFLTGSTRSTVMPFSILSSDSPNLLAAEVNDSVLKAVESAVTVNNFGHPITYSNGLKNGKYSAGVKFACPEIQIAES